MFRATKELSNKENGIKRESKQNKGRKEAGNIFFRDEFPLARCRKLTVTA